MSYHWFRGASVAELVKRLTEAGPDAVLEVHQEGEKMTFRVTVKKAITVGEADINDSFVCPPICP